jgi:hypothetical protein
MVILIATMLVATVYPAVSVKADSSNTQKVINELGIMNTDKGSSNALTAKVSRAEFAQMLINLSAKKDYITAEANVSLFSDVKKSHWAAGYIQAVIEQGYMSGYINGSFKPSQSVTLKEAVYAVVKLLGYSNADFTGNVYTGMYKLYTSKEMNENITKTAAQALTRNDCSNLFYNVLTTTNKEGKVYGTTLGYTVDSSGEINYLTLVSSALKGPVIVKDDWKSQIPFSLAQAKYYKNDKTSSLTAIDQYDVVYYSQSQKTLWVYDTKVTGTIQSIGTNSLVPDSVTVAGTQYTLSTSAVKEQLASSGTFKTGDTVTLLLGNDNTVVYILGLDELNVSVTGLVLSTGRHSVTNAKGEYVNTAYMTVVDASGGTFEQDYDSTSISYTTGQLVRITYTDGISTAASYTPVIAFASSVSFSADGTSLGDYKLSSGIKILDYKNGSYTSLYARRLAGAMISSGNVIYYKLNTRNEITELILNNASGDLYEYGINLGLKSGSGSTFTYQYLLNGKSGTATSSDFIAVDSGPLGFLLNGTEISAVMNLVSTAVKSVGTTYIQDSSAKYLLSENLQVYFYDGADYSQTTLSKVSNLTKYKLTAYYDKNTALGGRVRVIIAQNAE